MVDLSSGNVTHKGLHLQMVTNLACTVEEQQPSLYVLSTTYQHPPLLMSMLDVDVNALDLLRESTYLRRYPKKGMNLVLLCHLF